MTPPKILEFTLRPVCPKCRDVRFDYQVQATVVQDMGNPFMDQIGGDLLLITCMRCGWKQYMFVADREQGK